jgi:Flp pilus assembly protein TadB
MHTTVGLILGLCFFFIANKVFTVPLYLQLIVVIVLFVSLFIFKSSRKKSRHI